MARRSLGVVLIVALLGWTVNWPILECKGLHSRAAVLVPAGASPAYQPEPSPTRHNCCPHKRAAAVADSAKFLSWFLRLLAAHFGCCSISEDRDAGLPPREAKEAAIAKFVLAVLPTAGEKVTENAQSFGTCGSIEVMARVPAPTVLRL